MESRTGLLSKIGIFIAVSVGLGFSLIGVPNVEPLSAVAFASGYLLGLAGGMAVGGISVLLFSLFNPLGPPIPAVIGAQVVAMTLVGASGYVWRHLVSSGLKSAIIAAAFGGVVTVGYSLLTDLAFAASIGKLSDPLPVIIAGLPFSLVHIISNSAIFFAVGAILSRRYPP